MCGQNQTLLVQNFGGEMFLGVMDDPILYLHAFAVIVVCVRVLGPPSSVIHIS